MGGQSYKCPKCKKWYLSKALLRAHLMFDHKEPKKFEIVGTGPQVRIARKDVDTNT